MKNLQSKQLFMSAYIALAAAILFNIAACGNNNAETATDSKTGEVAATGTSQSFRTGRFKYDDPVNFGDFFIIRSADSQIDSGGITRLWVKFDLIWENDTSYTLNYKETIKNETNISLPDLNGMFRKCQMTEITDTSYIEVSTSSLNKDTLRTKIVRM